MKILLVNCYKDETGFHKFKEFILKLMTSKTIAMIPEDIEIITKKISELSELVIDFGTIEEDPY